MWELRWVLLGLGALLIIGIYFRGKLPFAGRAAALRDALPRFRLRGRAEPTLSEDEPTVADSGGGSEPHIGAFTQNEADGAKGTRGRVEPAFGSDSDEPVPVRDNSTPRETLSPDAPERVIALRFVAKAAELNLQEAILALRAAGLEHGRYGVFHRVARSGSAEPLFSVANLTEPGSFDLTAAAERTLPGMTFFMVLPGVGDPVERFDDMVQTARALARELDAELFDDRGSSWSIQRERYVREEVIRYRHQHGYEARSS
jgi:cell division protein ZipA